MIQTGNILLFFVESSTKFCKIYFSSIIYYFNLTKLAFKYIINSYIHIVPSTYLFLYKRPRFLPYISTTVSTTTSSMMCAYYYCYFCVPKIKNNIIKSINESKFVCHLSRTYTKKINKR